MSTRRLPVPHRRRVGLMRLPTAARLPRVPGRRITDPVDAPPQLVARGVRGRLAAVSVSASMGAGAWVGFALGLVVGAFVGAATVWFAGAILDWQRDLAFTLGVARRLLPFGDQLGLLRDIGARWFIVIPGIAVAVGLLAATVGALVGGLLAAAYNRSPRHALVIVELPRAVVGDGRVTSDGELPLEGDLRPPESLVVHSAPHGDDREE